MDNPIVDIVTANALSYRSPMPVTKVRLFQFTDGLTSFPVCPRCHNTMEREYQSYCDRCGQALDWSTFDSAVILLPP